MVEEPTQPHPTSHKEDEVSALMIQNTVSPDSAQRGAPQPPVLHSMDPKKAAANMNLTQKKKTKEEKGENRYKTRELSGTFDEQALYKRKHFNFKENIKYSTKAHIPPNMNQTMQITRKSDVESKRSQHEFFEEYSLMSSNMNFMKADFRQTVQEGFKNYDKGQASRF